MHSTEDMAPRKRSYDRVPLRSRGETEPLPDRPSARDGIEHLRQASCTTTSTDVTLRPSTLPSDDSVALKSRMLKEQVGKSISVLHRFSDTNTFRNRSPSLCEQPNLFVQNLTNSRLTWAETWQNESARGSRQTLELRCPDHHLVASYRQVLGSKRSSW
jgi:hypothetical protein